MMDKNKLAKLEQIGYSFNNCCAICAHGVFRPNTMFGACVLHNYDHLKHTGPTRDLSIHMLGGCLEGFSLGDNKLHILDQFAMLIKREG
jgi:hypothetical protein